LTDNAFFRHRKSANFDLDEEDPLEVEAFQYGLNTSARWQRRCNVNGRDSPCTMDIIKYAGALPATFSTLRGASAEQSERLPHSMSDPRQPCSFNIFGGNPPLDVLATGVVVPPRI